MYVIPAIDIIDGKCVRLQKGDYSLKREYGDNPLDTAKSFEAAGLTRLHLVDLDGAREKSVVNLHVLDAIASGTGLKIDFGGGLRSNNDVARAFDAGADQVTAGSIAVHNPEKVLQWIERWGADKIILGADVSGDHIAASAWKEQTGLDWRTFISDNIKIGIQYVVSTSIENDGMLQGPSFSLYKEMQSLFPQLHIVASGGVSNLDDLKELAAMNIYGVIVGKAFYEGKISIQDMSDINNRAHS